MDVILFPGEAPYANAATNLHPIIAVEIEGEFPIIVTVLVDSGADFSVFDAQFAEFAGIVDISSGTPQPLSGVGGETGIVGYTHLVSVVIAGRRVRLPVTFVALPEGVPNLLGRAGVFDIGPIGFDQPNRRVLLPFWPS